ncbi:peptidylprolyl isomerase, partial [Paenarthrobacter ureafaciens]|uniref:peptidylprolyl isomerase n=1 Tax=Paenarthrobacter ureafaciens TaxID=37931 RepID=UPI00397A44EA
IHTSLGDIKVDLFGNHAPKTVANFIGCPINGVWVPAVFIGWWFFRTVRRT